LEEDSSNNGLTERLKGLIRFFFRRRNREGFEEEFHDLINGGEGKGLIDQYSGDWIHRILEFKDTVAREVMIPRTEIVCFQADTSVEKVLELAIESGHSRLPMYGQNIDDIIGIFCVKDLLRHWGKKGDEIDLSTMTRPPYFVPEMKNIGQLLQEFKKNRSHMAIVIDEYGGTAGLITIEDIIEEIFGEIQDEHDMEEARITPMPDGTLMVDARTNVDELEEYFKIDIPKDNFETVGGLIVHLMGRVPRAGEEVHYRGLHIVIHDSDQKKVSRVKVRLTQAESRNSA
jgi:CBS domain containing-hemolysin-like protein